MKLFPCKFFASFLSFVALGSIALQAAPEPPAPDEVSRSGRSASSQQLPADPVVGKWIWHHGGTATFNADGTCTNDGVVGAWQFLNNPGTERAYTINWEHGRYTDKLIFAKDGQSALLIGNSKENYTVSRAPDPVVGKWAWHHGETATFKPDGTCDLTDGMHGTWQFMNNPDAERKYTVVWNQGRYTDQLVFNADGKSALLIASTRENYTVERTAE